MCVFLLCSALFVLLSNGKHSIRCRDTTFGQNTGLVSSPAIRILLPYVIRDKVVGAGDARVGQRRAGLFLFKVMPTRGWMRGMRAKLR